MLYSRQVDLNSVSIVSAISANSVAVPSFEKDYSRIEFITRMDATVRSVLIIIMIAMSSSVKCYSSLIVEPSSPPSSSSSLLGSSQIISGKQSALATPSLMVRPIGPAEHDQQSNNTTTQSLEGFLNNTTSDYGTVLIRAFSPVRLKLSGISGRNCLCCRVP